MATTLFNDLVTFSRGTNATVVGPNGLIQWAPNNLLTNSESFNASTWVRSGTSAYPFDPVTATYGSDVSGTLLNSAGWIVDGCAITTNGSGLDFAFTGSNKFAYKAITVTTGRWYRFTVTFSGATANMYWSSVGLNGSMFGATVPAPTLTGYFFATTSSPVFGIASFSGAGTTTVSSISVNEVIGGLVTAPNGTETAEAILEDTATSVHRVQQLQPLLASVPYTLSVFAKRSSGSRNLSINCNAIGNAQGLYNLANGTVIGTSGTATNLSASIQNAGNGWFRCTLTMTGTAVVNNVYLQLAPSTETNPDWGASYTGNGNSGILIWGAQLELGSTATAYNPTTVKNLLGFSEAFDNAAWGKTNVSIVTGAQANPVNGLFNAQKLMENTVNSQHRIAQSVALAAAPYTLSAYLKAGGRTWALVLNGTIANAFAYFDLSAGVVGSIGVGVSAASIVDAGNGWYRCSIIFTAPAGGNAIEFRAASTNGVGSYLGDGNSGIYIWGAQLSDSASLDAYVPSPGAAPTSTAYYGPRFDHDPVTLAPRGLLIEEARTNLATFSQDMFNAGYIPVNGTRTTSTVVGPDGVTNLAQFTSTTTGGNRLQFFQNVTSGVTYTLSVVMSAGTSSFGGLVAAASAGAGAIFSLLGNGSVVSTAGASVTASIQKLSATLYRCSMTFPATATGSCLLGWGVSNGTTYESGVYPSAAAGFVYGSLVQLEAGAFATSYIPTVGSTVLRSADVATLAGSNFSGWYGQSEGTFVFDFGPFNFSGTIAGTGPYDTAIGAVTDGVRAGRQFSAQNLNGWSTQNKTGTPIASAIISGSIPFGPTNGPAAAQKLAIFQTANSIGGVINGGTVTSTAITVAPTGSSSLFYIDSRMNGHLRSIAYFNNRLSDAQLQVLTEPPLITSLSLDFINNLYEG